MKRRKEEKKKKHKTVKVSLVISLYVFLLFLLTQNTRGSILNLSHNRKGEKGKQL